MWKTDKFTIYISNGVYSFSIPFTACYYDDAQQEAEMDVAVLQLLDTLNLDGKSDYEKIKGVYDYICSNVNYDDTNLNNDAYKLKFTAYAALVNKTAVCQGYRYWENEQWQRPSCLEHHSAGQRHILQCRLHLGRGTNQLRLFPEGFRL